MCDTKNKLKKEADIIVLINKEEKDFIKKHSPSTTVIKTVSKFYLEETEVGLELLHEFRQSNLSKNIMKGANADGKRI